MFQRRKKILCKTFESSGKLLQIEFESLDIKSDIVPKKEKLKLLLKENTK